jgi:hypothetical protein
MHEIQYPIQTYIANQPPPLLQGKIEKEQQWTTSKPPLLLSPLFKRNPLSLSCYQLTPNKCWKWVFLCCTSTSIHNHNYSALSIFHPSGFLTWLKEVGKETSVSRSRRSCLDFGLGLRIETDPISDRDRDS